MKSAWGLTYGACIHQNKDPVQDDEYSYHDSLQVRLLEGMGTVQLIFRWPFLSDDVISHRFMLSC